MFKKFDDTQISGITQLKTSVQKGIRNKIVEEYPLIEDFIDEIIPKKESLRIAKCQQHVEVLVASNGDHLFFRQRDGPYFPTLRLIHKYPFVCPLMQVDSGAIQFVLGGANVMSPGLTSKGALMTPGLKAGSVVTVVAEGKEHALAIGILKLSSDDIKTSRRNCEDTGVYELIKDGVEDNIVVLKAVTEGEKLKLNCEYCGQKVMQKEVVWKRRKFYKNIADFVHVDNYFDKLDNRVVLGKSNSLIMKSVKEEDSGFYYCINTVDNTTSTEYLVDVQTPSPLDAVVGNDADFDSFIAEYINSLNTSFLTGRFEVNASSTSLTNVTLYFDTSKYLIGMHWGQWTVCKPCGTVNGEQRREAHCRLYHKVRLLVNNDTLDIPQPSVGCRSKLLENIPKLAHLLETIPDFVSTRSCHVNCTEKFYGANIALETNIFQKGSEAKKKLKKFFQRFKHSTDVTAAPVIEPASFPLSSVVEFEGSRIHIRCPGVVARSRVDWYFKYHLLHPHRTELQTRGRVRIDSKNYRISFLPLKQSDSGVYTCIVYGIQKGNIELRVVKYNAGIDVRSPIGAMKAASIASTSLFITLTCIRLTCRLRKRKH